MVNAWSLLYDEVVIEEHFHSDANKFSSTKQQNHITNTNQLTSRKKTGTIDEGKL